MMMTMKMVRRVYCIDINKQNDSAKQTLLGSQSDFRSRFAKDRRQDSCLFPKRTKTEANITFVNTKLAIVATHDVQIKSISFITQSKPNQTKPPFIHSTLNRENWSFGKDRSDHKRFIRTRYDTNLRLCVFFAALGLNKKKNENFLIIMNRNFK